MNECETDSEHDDALSFELCRPVEPHARQVMEWRNDPGTLAMSYHHARKTWDGFWPEFRDTYFSHAPEPLFVRRDGGRVGFLRFRPVPHPEGRAGPCVDISINVAPEARGRGLGVEILRAASDRLRRDGVDAIYAEVRAENAASIRAFETAGYASLGPAEKLIEDTGERAAIVRFVHELVSPAWRRDRVLVIAEAGSNWRLGTPARDRAMARALIDAAAEAGADAVKFQTYRPETVYVAGAGASSYLADAGIDDEIGDVFADLAMPYEMLPELADHCRAGGVAFMSTGFSVADFEAIDPHVEIHKIASYEISHPRLLEAAARSGKPLVLSTGASTESDIAWAVAHFHAHGGRDLCLLQCTAKYPAPLSTVNLRALPWLRRRFGVPVGLSDHSRDPITAPVGAVALGARVVEKHFTLHRALPGPDHSFALTPAELATMVRHVRAAEEALGAGDKVVQSAEQELAAFARRGVQATRDVAPGDELCEGVNVDILRPGRQTLGVHPRHLPEIEARRATRALGAGEGLRPGDWD